MKITKTDGPPEDILYFDNELNLTPKHAEDIVEIFQTPLTGAYNWDYTVADNRIKKLYELGKELNWNGSIDLNWDYTHPAGEKIIETDDELPHETLATYEALSEEEKIEFDRHDLAELLSQFLHGEQGALLVASQLTSCAPTYNAKLYAASQTFDEARHVEVFNRYLQEKVGMHYPINPNLKALLDKILTDPRWDLKFIGMQIVIEGLALAAFQMLKGLSKDPLLTQLLHYVIRDEARHVTFGINYLEDFIKTLSPEEIEDRAEFAYEACVISRERLINTKAMQKFLKLSEEEAREFALSTSANATFRNFLFSRIMPNLSRIGLLTDKVRPKFEALGLLEYEDAPDDFECDWTELEKPLEQFGEIPQAS
ncbi:ferritin-like domain-containing protein [Gammaproteobacteria bacterium]|nr:ferritin-like domain-containing protein [Gammaproteobacteria bacterium]MDB9700614.1 ferritin-like domain-containing protein [Gammaproteobacteria bacterium]MDC1325917.1 ferritin-like domain-containing protein [Gammaproteobacteria bacterium]